MLHFHQDFFLAHLQPYSRPLILYHRILFFFTEWYITIRLKRSVPCILLWVTSFSRNERIPNRIAIGMLEKMWLSLGYQIVSTVWWAINLQKYSVISLSRHFSFRSTVQSILTEKNCFLLLSFEWVWFAVFSDDSLDWCTGKDTQVRRLIPYFSMLI